MNGTAVKRTGGKKRLILLTALAVLLLLLVLALDSRLAVRTYTLETDEVTAPMRLAVVTDLHSCAYGENQEELASAVLNLDPQPDGVLLVGDIVDDQLPEENAWTAVSRLAEFYCCFYVTGNHEWWSGEAERICREMERLGVTVLRGQSVSLSTSQGQTVEVCGIDDPDSGAEGQLEQVGNSVNEDTFTILMAHRPEMIDEYRKYPFDLVVSGHAHGGQWRIPGLLNGLYAPNQGLFPQYAGGQYDWEETTLVVSRGLARESTRVPRLFNRPEVVVLDILPS